jgi:hypothetical protein
MDKNIFTYMAEAYDRYRADRRAASSDETDVRQSRLRRVVRWFIPNGGTLLLVIALIATAQVWARPLASPTGAPGPSATTVNYQGRLSDSDGVPLDGTYGMRFALYDAATDGNLIWGPENHTAVAVSDGLFSVGLGSKTSGGIPTTTWNGDRYLEITVGGETLEPRELIRSVPIAGMALTVPDGAIGSRHVSLSNGRIRPSGSEIALTDTYEDIPDVSVILAPATDQTYLVILTVDFHVSNGLALAKLQVDDGDVPTGGGLVMFQGKGDGRERGTVSQSYLIDLEAGTHTLDLQARLYSGTSAWVGVGHTTITYMAISQ